jgi:hypothetical protein
MVAAIGPGAALVPVLVATVTRLVAPLALLHIAALAQLLVSALGLALCGEVSIALGKGNASSSRGQGECQDGGDDRFELHVDLLRVGRRPFRYANPIARASRSGTNQPPA